MWLMGMLDAYGDDELIIEGGGRQILHKASSVLSLTVIPCAVIVLIISWTTSFVTKDDRLRPDIQDPVIFSKNDDTEDGDEEEENTNEENIAIEAYDLKPAIAEPGAKLTIEYRIDTSKTVDVVLGFSIQKTGSNTWIDDPANDKTVKVVPGNGTYSRDFVLPTTLASGKYSVLLGIWSPDFATTYDSKRFDNGLTIIEPSLVKDRYPSPGSLPDRTVAFEDENTGAHPNGNVVISSYKLESNVVTPGATLTIKYTINAARSTVVKLGFSIQKSGTNKWISDPANDKMVRIILGSNSYSREFSLPYTLAAGKYNVALALWNQDLTIAYDSKLFNNDLTVSVRSDYNDQADVSQFSTIQDGGLQNNEESRMTRF
jgi:hypothetical protein